MDGGGFDLVIASRRGALGPGALSSLISPSSFSDVLSVTSLLSLLALFANFPALAGAALAALPLFLAGLGGNVGAGEGVTSFFALDLRAAARRAATSGRGGGGGAVDVRGTEGSEESICEREGAGVALDVSFSFGEVAEARGSALIVDAADPI